MVSEQYKYDTRVLHQNLYCNYAKMLDGEISHTRLMTTFFLIIIIRFLIDLQTLLMKLQIYLLLIISEKRLVYVERQNCLKCWNKKQKT